MSLIVATSRIDENTLPQPSEKPSNFKNFFRSPIEIEPDSEIAVQSVKIQRSGNISVEEDDFFCHYFGTDPANFASYRELLSLSRTIKIPRGTYSLAGYEKAIQDTLNTQYDDPRTFGGYGVDINVDASGQELGVEIQGVDKGSATGKDLHASMISQPVFNIANPFNVYKGKADTGSAVIVKSSEFTYTGGTGVFASTENTTKLNESRSIGILTGFPFGMNQGKFIIELINASDAPYAIGLSRPQIQVESYRNSSEAQTTNERYSNIYTLDKETAQQRQQETGIITYDDSAYIGGTYEVYDYVFMLDNVGTITIAQRVWDNDHEQSTMQEVDYWNNTYTGSPGTAKLTKAQFYATWDGIMFEGQGDEVRLYFKQKGKAVFDVVVASTFDSGSPGSAFSPIGTTSYALYPMLNIGKGSATITKMESSNTLNQYKYPVFTDTPTGGYVAGNDAFSNEGFYYLPRDSQYSTIKKPYVSLSDAIASNSIQDIVYAADSSVLKRTLQDPALVAYGNYFYELLNGANGVDYKHLFTISKFIVPDRFDTLIKSQLFPNMAGRLGFPDRAFLISNNTDGYVSGDNTLTIKFTSTAELTKTSISSFIRIPNLTHKTFNGAQSGLSKIVYQLPQFANGGRQFGALFFEASEKTYVKLHNTSPMLLNMLQVQIVDSQERELNSLVGDTQVVFHVRKSV